MEENDEMNNHPAVASLTYSCSSDSEDEPDSSSRMIMPPHHGHYERARYGAASEVQRGERLHHTTCSYDSLGYYSAHSIAENDPDETAAATTACTNGDLKASLTNFFGYVPTMKHAAAPLAPPPALDYSNPNEASARFSRPRQLPTTLEPLMASEGSTRKHRLSVGRSIGRRGGVCHSDLLKSAVMATLESYDSDVDEDAEDGVASDRKTRQNTVSGSLSEVTTATNSFTSADDSVATREARKRARTSFNEESHEDPVGLESSVPMLEDCLLGAMDICTISRCVQSDQERHVARRTSKEQERGVMQSPRGSIDHHP